MSAIPSISHYEMPNDKTIPKNIAIWKIDPNRAVFLIHDMQNYFLRPFSSQEFKSQLTDNILSVRKFCVKNNIPVAYTKQPGNMSIKERGLLKDFWGDGMKATPEDKQIIDKLKPEDGDWLFDKWRYSAFYNSTLLEKLHKAKRDQLIISGVYAHIGILTTALEAFSNDIQVFLLADGIADFSEENHLMTLRYASCCCAVTVLTNRVIS